MTEKRIDIGLNSMVLSSYSLDKFVAHQLSKVTACGAPDLGEAKKSFLNAFIMNTMLGVTIEPKTKAFLFNYLRRVEGAFRTYHSARNALTNYISTPSDVISPYFEALLEFEVCVAQSYQALEMLAKSMGVEVFDKSDDKSYKRLHTLYVDSKHMDRMIHGGKIPEDATSGVWISNDGLESKRGTMAFNELADILRFLNRIAEQVANVNVPKEKSGF